MLVPEREGRAIARFLGSRIGAAHVTTLHAAVPFNGEDHALYLNRIPGTCTFLGVHKPGTPIVSAYPHFPVFIPDEQTMGAGIRAMARWLSHRIS